MDGWGGFSFVLLGMVGVILAHCSSSVAAWGAAGHHMTCHIAEPLLTPEAAAAVKSLLPDYANGTLAPLCSWADEIRWMYKWHWTGPLHYIDTPDFMCNYNYDRDCHNELFQQNMCVAGAINNYSSQLLGYKAPSSDFKSASDAIKQKGSSDNLTEALLFLSHYVGDIHQPLHVGFTGDAGGNTIMVHWYTRKYNLHHIWDNEFINRARDQFFAKDLDALTNAIYLNVTTSWLEDAHEWAKCPGDGIPCPDLYASESINLACKFAYRNATPGSTLKDEYFLSRWPIVERRLAQGGVRLATLLNYLFSTKSPSPSI